MALDNDFNNNAPPEEKPQPGALVVAARKRDIEAITELLARGVDVNETTSSGDTALMWAAFYGDQDIALLLLEHGADTAAEDGNGCTAAYFAAQLKHEEVLQRLNEAPVLRQQALERRAAEKESIAREEIRKVTDAQRREQLRGRAPKLIIRPAGGSHVRR